MINIRDPLVLTYETIKKAVKTVHGADFLVIGDLPNDADLKEQLPCAKITNISTTSEKAFMREFEPHDIKYNSDGTCIVATEMERLYYIMEISFFASEKEIVQKLSTEFVLYIEQFDELPIINDFWSEKMQIFLETPPTSPYGENGLYQCKHTWLCRGKLIMEEIVKAVDVTNLKFKIENI